MKKQIHKVYIPDSYSVRNEDVIDDIVNVVNSYKQCGISYHNCITIITFKEKEDFDDFFNLFVRNNKELLKWNGKRK